MKKKVFISKVFQMSFAMLFLNISNICYNIFISKKAGAAGIGMFHLVMSIYSLAVTISVSGIGLTATRLISDMPSPLARSCADNIVVKCMKVCLVPAGIASVVLFCASDYIAARLLYNPQCSICLKILSPSLIFTAISSVINGYFTAFGRIKSMAFGRIVSDAGVWTGTLLLLGTFSGNRTYMAVVISFSLGIILQSICDITIWRKSQSSLYCNGGADYKSILGLCAPLAVGSYLRCGLTSAENILIPAMLTAHGVANSVASYGIIKGMTLPILMFPAVFTGAFTSLIVPEVARRRSLGYKNGIKYISSLSIEYMLKFAFFVSAVYIRWHTQISQRFFSESDVSRYLHMLSILPVFLFFDSIVDSVLKGMDEQVASLKINIVDSFCRVLCIVVFVPRLGMAAYIGIMYLSEIINLLFSYVKLKKISNLSFPLKKGVIVPLVALALSTIAAKPMPQLGLWGDICLFAAFYIASVYFLSAVNEKL